MKPVNIYALTRPASCELQSRMEKQMSGRGRALRIKAWETEGLRLFSKRLTDISPDACSLEFYYSFTMSKLGKEFDLLRVNDDFIVNIELKSGNVTDEAVRNQLLQNRYYLSTLGRGMYFYTFISGRDRLVRLSNSGRLVDCTFEELYSLLEKQDNCLDSDIESLFQEDKYLISPVTDPGRFLRQEYFLTSQQRDIRKQILKNIGEGHMLQGFTGLPGTGKTILLYDLAMQLSRRNPVCLFHFASRKAELKELDARLKRIDFYFCDGKSLPEISKEYAAIFVDEGHDMGKEAYSKILALSKALKAPVIISYDNLDCVSEAEREGFGAPVIEAAEDFRSFHLTNRIRLNKELSTFLRTLLSSSKIHRRDYPNVSVEYGNDAAEAGRLLENYRNRGYEYISGSVTGREFDKVVMLLDDSFYYDEEGFLRSRGSATDGERNRIMELFHGLSRAKEKIALVIRGNLKLTEQIYMILQK
ncbi:MAG: ATP-binding protein [Lachnospiraceae bacterium]|nr:ATP-binding protein [Lachnospiraceae bacterium]